MATGLEKLRQKQDFAQEAENAARGPKIEIRKRKPEPEAAESVQAPQPAAAEEGKKPSSALFQWTAWISPDYKRKLAFLKAASEKNYRELMEEAIEYLCGKYGV